MNKVACAALLTLSLGGCTTYQMLSDFTKPTGDIEVGMTRDQVLQVMGKGNTGYDGSSTWWYTVTGACTVVWDLDKDPIVVRFMDGC